MKQYQPQVWRIAQFLAKSHLLFKKPTIVVHPGKTDRVVLRVVRLHQHRSQTITPACPSRHLGQDLKGILSSAEIRPLQSNICTHHPHQSDIRKVVAFGDHLSTNKNIGPPTAEIREKLEI